MQILEIIRQRRSIRQYKDTPLSDKQINRILEAGRWAPSGLNNQPWKFLVIKDKTKKENFSQFTKYADIISDADIIICVFLDNGATYNREKDLMAIGACIQNMLLEAHAIGIGTCWLGEILNQRKKVEDFLKIEPDLELMAVITAGFSDENITQGCRKSLKSLLVKSK